MSALRFLIERVNVTGDALAMEYLQQSPNNEWGWSQRMPDAHVFALCKDATHGGQSFEALWAFALSHGGHPVVILGSAEVAAQTREAHRKQIETEYRAREARQHID